MSDHDELSKLARDMKRALSVGNDERNRLRKDQRWRRSTEDAVGHVVDVQTSLLNESLMTLTVAVALLDQVEKLLTRTTAIETRLDAIESVE